MTILDFKNPEQEKLHQTQDNESLKWRRSGIDRRTEDSGSKYMDERRQPKGRRTRWLEIVSSIIFPRESKLK